MISWRRWTQKNSVAGEKFIPSQRKLVLLVQYMRGNIEEPFPLFISNNKMSVEKSSCKNSCSSKLLKVFFVLSLLAAIFAGFDQVKDRFYIFDQHVLHDVAKRNIEKYSNDTHALITNIAQDLEKQYPGHIQLKEEWVFNNAGGAMGAMWILHASITEYVIIFGTPVGTEGHTGRFQADDYFIILEGEQWAYAPGELKREVNNCFFCPMDQEV